MKESTIDTCFSPDREISIKNIPGEFQGHQVRTWLAEYHKGEKWKIHNGFREGERGEGRGHAEIMVAIRMENNRTFSCTEAFLVPRGFLFLFFYCT